MPRSASCLAPPWRASPAWRQRAVTCCSRQDGMSRPRDCSARRRSRSWSAKRPTPRCSSPCACWGSARNGYTASGPTATAPCLPTISTWCCATAPGPRLRSHRPGISVPAPLIRSPPCFRRYAGTAHGCISMAPSGCGHAPARNSGLLLPASKRLTPGPPTATNGCRFLMKPAMPSSRMATRTGVRWRHRPATWRRSATKSGIPRSTSRNCRGGRAASRPGPCCATSGATGWRRWWRAIAAWRARSRRCWPLNPLSASSMKSS
ncbi:hypothetical protein D3C72_1586610 [compost metagenome]